MHCRVLLIKEVSVFKYLFIHIYLYLYLVIFIFSFTFTTVITYKMIHYNSVTKSKIVQDSLRFYKACSHDLSPRILHAMWISFGIIVCLLA